MTMSMAPGLNGAIERELVVSAQAGDTASFESLVRRHVDRLYGAARLLLRDTDIAEDAVQQALVRAWRDLRSLRDPGKFGSWLQTLLVRACYDEIRRKRRWLAEVRVLQPVQVGAMEPASTDDREIIERAFRVLSTDHRTILVLHFYLDLSAIEIGGRLGIPPGTARSRLHYALTALRAAVEADERSERRSSGSVA
jgi:RNA polymerase sigma-70 factor (ECF subfamily)